MLSFFRDAKWLNAERARVYSLMIFVALAAAALWIIASQAFISHVRYTQGGDFVSFYAAAKLAVGGHATDAWHRAVHARMESTIAPGQGYLAFFYPPPYLLLLWPFGWLPYGAAVLTWLTVTNALAIFALYRGLKALAPNVRPAIIPLLAFPALWINLGCGQNGALTLALLAGGALWLDRRPWLAGAILGLLVIKPQLAIVLPVALLVCGRWKPLLAMGLSALALSGLAWLAVGATGYTAFLQASHDATQSLVLSLVNPAQMQSLYAALKLLKTPIIVAMTAQGLLSLAVLGLTAYAARRYRPDGFSLVALCVSATVLATPFLLDYDLAITALPIAWLLVSGARDGRRPWEATIALLAALLPLLSRQIALHLAVPLAPLVLLMLFAAVFGRVRAYSIYSGASMRLPSNMASDTIRSGEKSASEALARTNSKKCA